ncbi:MAG: hypothetical protein HQ578_05520 [Chloroflexi bacterium]|nr:hypothetical protein [Chloroflexota bacterium]
MPTDWDEALRIAGRGFGATILVLFALSLITWFVGLALQKVAARKEKGGEIEKGDV